MSKYDFLFFKVGRSVVIMMDGVRKIWVYDVDKALTLRRVTWHALTNQKPIPTSPDGTMMFFRTTDFITVSLIKF